jgi:hypothetical protein
MPTYRTQGKHSLNFLSALLPVFLMLLGACASEIWLDPKLAEAPKPQTALHLRGTLAFSGGRDFLPTALVAMPTEGKAEPIFSYAYADRYQETTIPEIIAFVNPLSGIGFPTGVDTIRVSARLEIRVEGKAVRTYGATGVIENRRNAFTGSPLAELRRRVLIAVAANIQQQMANDAEAIEAIIQAASRTTKGP